MSMVNTAPVPLSAIHFLIHPLYGAFTGSEKRLLTEREFIERGRPVDFYYVGANEIAEDLTSYPPLVQAYRERASLIGKTEALATFLPCERDTPTFFDERFETMFASLMEGLRELLGLRHVVFYGDVDPVDQPTAGASVRYQLAKRGFVLPDNLPSYAFGESLEHCIPYGVRNLRRGLRLRQFTRVDPLFTDMRSQWPAMSKDERKSLRADLRSFGIVLRSES